jgi:hypothetical protein
VHHPGGEAPAGRQERLLKSCCYQDRPVLPFLRGAIATPSEAEKMSGAIASRGARGGLAFYFASYSQAWGAPPSKRRGAWRQDSRETAGDMPDSSPGRTFIETLMISANHLCAFQRLRFQTLVFLHQNCPPSFNGKGLSKLALGVHGLLWQRRREYLRQLVCGFINHVKFEAPSQCPSRCLSDQPCASLCLWPPPDSGFSSRSTTCSGASASSVSWSLSSGQSSHKPLTLHTLKALHKMPPGVLARAQGQLLALLTRQAAALCRL